MLKTRIGKLLLIVLVAGISIVGVYPLKTTVVPEWKVRVIDEKGSPLSNIGVREVWQHYSIESKDHEEDLPTDHNGHVTFPKRTIRSTLAIRIIRSAINSLNPHASSGPGAYLIILAPAYETSSTVFYTPGQPLPSEVVVKKAN